MKVLTIIRPLFVLVVLGLGQSLCQGKTMVNTTFSPKNTFAKLGWKPAGAWNIFKYKTSKKNPGWLARFPANPPSDGTLTKKFPVVKNPRQLTLSVDLGWGWGASNQSSDADGFMLVNAQGNGYAFAVHRTQATWAVQWAKVVNYVAPAQWNWSPRTIDAGIPSVLDGGGLEHVVVTRNAKGHWAFSCKTWNNNAGGKVTFKSTATQSFSKIILLGWKNFDDEVYNHVVLKVKK